MYCQEKGRTAKVLNDHDEQIQKYNLPVITTFLVYDHEAFF
jgi:hypothetical protein